ncbi:MAG: ribosomal protein [Nevskia sp.]|nr:ribosomal protein [Nevskia sp.]
MEMILLEKVKNLGDLGDVVKVKSGYGRNFLLPTGKALTATEANKKVFETRKAALLKKAQDSLVGAKARAEKLAGAVVKVKALAADEGKLYGSVGPAEIARAAEAQGLDVKKSELDMPEGAIRMIGTYTVVARFHTEIEAAITVVVEEEKA